VQKEKEGVSNWTNNSYRVACDRIEVAIGDMFVKEVKAVDCQRILENMVAQGYRQGTVKVQKTVIVQLFRWSVIQGDIDISPAAAVTLPRKISKKSRYPLTAEQIKAVTECREGEWWLLGLAFLWTGCRRGELLALRYEDIDRVNKRITINKKLDYSTGVPKLENHTKTEAGMRTIPLLSPLANALPKDRIGLIFHDGEGGYINQSAFMKIWKEYQDIIGLADEITPHFFRHTFATICYDAGAGSKEAAAMLGHASDQVTMEIYTHLSKQKQEIAADCMERYAATI
jgi:integrase